MFHIYKNVETLQSMDTLNNSSGVRYQENNFYKSPLGDIGLDLEGHFQGHLSPTSFFISDY